MVRRIRACAVCVSNEHVLAVRLRDPVSAVEFCVVPGGMVEPGETEAEAAAREAFEEAGIRVLVDAQSPVIARYPFVWAGRAHDVTTHFFPAVPADPGLALPLVGPRPGEPDHQLGALWIPLASAEESLGWNAAIWTATSECIGLARALGADGRLRANEP